MQVNDLDYITPITENMSTLSRGVLYKYMLSVIYDELLYHDASPFEFTHIYCSYFTVFHIHGPIRGCSVSTDTYSYFHHVYKNVQFYAFSPSTFVVGFFEYGCLRFHG